MDSVSDLTFDLRDCFNRDSHTLLRIEVLLRATSNDINSKDKSWQFSTIGNTIVP